MGVTQVLKEVAELMERGRAAGREWRLKLTERVTVRKKKMTTISMKKTISTRMAQSATVLALIMMKMITERVGLISIKERKRRASKQSALKRLWQV
jgi:hypothetical protein